MKKNNITRRDFIKLTGASAAAVGVAACTGGKTAKTTSTQDEGPEQMPLRQCGEDQVSLLGYGCMRWQMIKDENGKDIINQESVNELIDYALAHGVNYIDSSPVYLQGQSERATALALLRHPRESYFIATKLSNFSDYSFEGSVKMYKRSLELYETDHIDYYLLHNISGAEAFNRRFLDNGVLDYLLKEKELGHIRKLGFSFHGYKQGWDEVMEIHDKYHFDFIQIQMNYVDWNHSAGQNTDASYMYADLEKRNTPIVIMEPLLGGALSNVPDAVAAELKQREPSKSVASWAFRFCGTKPQVLCVLSGMTYMEHLQDNLNTYLHFKPLNDEELNFLESMAGLIRNYPLINCTDCKYCMPCPYGIDIPTIFLHYNQQVNTSMIAESTEQENYRKLKKHYLTTYDKAVESLRQADHCTGCNQCTVHCPQNIRIPQQLQRIDRYIESLKQDKL